MKLEATFSTFFHGLFYTTYVEMEQFYVVLNLFPIERAPSQLTPTFTSCSGLYIVAIKSEFLKMWPCNIRLVKNNTFRGISGNFRTSRIQTFFGGHAPRRLSVLTFTGPDTYFPSLFRLQSKIEDHGRLSLRISP